MKVQAEISIYPLRTQSLSEAVEMFCNVLRNHGLKVETTSMSSIITGQSDVLFKACEDAFEQLAKKYKVVMNMKISNTCPLDESN